MNVLFLLTTVGSKVHAHHPTGFLSAVLKEAGHNTEFIELSNLNYDLLRERIETFKPNVLAASSVMQQMPYVTNAINYAKAAFPELTTVLGGTHPILVPNSINSIEGLDALCVGEGELPLLELVNAVEGGNDLTAIPNFRIRTGSKEIVSTPLSYAVTEADLAVLPMQHHEIFPRFRDADRDSKLSFVPRVLWGRGCPYACSYCAVPSLRKALKEPMKESGAKWVRYPPVERAIEEIMFLSDRWKFDTFVIDDDVLSTRRDWVLELANKYPDSLRGKLSFEANLRVESIDRETMYALKDMGCNLLKFGLENGNYDLRRKILKRPIPDERIEEVFSWAHEVGIPAHTFNMVGVPGETKDTFWETVKLNRKIKPERVQITVFFPYSGVPLGEKALANGKLAKQQDSYFNGAAVEIDDLSMWRVEMYARWFKFLVYSGYSPAIAWKAGVTALKEEKYRIKNAGRSFLKSRLSPENFARVRALAAAVGLSGGSWRSKLPVETMGSDGERPDAPLQQDIEDMDQSQVTPSECT